MVGIVIQRKISTLIRFVEEEKARKANSSLSSLTQECGNGEFADGGTDRAEKKDLTRVATEATANSGNTEALVPGISESQHQGYGLTTSYSDPEIYREWRAHSASYVMPTPSTETGNTVASMCTDDQTQGNLYPENVQFSGVNWNRSPLPTMTPRTPLAGMSPRTVPMQAMASFHGEGAQQIDNRLPSLRPENDY